MKATTHRRAPDALLTGRRVAYRLVSLQALVGLLWSLVVFLWSGTEAGWSACWGVAAVVVPNAVFAYRAFRFGGATRATAIVRQFYWGQTLKMGLTIVILTLAFAWGHAQPMPLMVALVLGLLTQRLSLLWAR